MLFLDNQEIPPGKWPVSKSRPISFNEVMIEALLEKRKSQTRRIVTPMPGKQSQWLTSDLINQAPSAVLCHSQKGDSYSNIGVQLTHPKGGPLGWIKCPYGDVGDLLWVKENWQIDADRIPFYIYKADGVKLNTINRDTRWKSSRFMPKAAARIWLEITRVWVERLLDISEQDATREGVQQRYFYPSRPYDLEHPETRDVQPPYGDGKRRPSGWADYMGGYRQETARGSFLTLFQKLHGKDITDINPWLFCIEFDILTTKGLPVSI